MNYYDQSRGWVYEPRSAEYINSDVRPDDYVEYLYRLTRQHTSPEFHFLFTHDEHQNIIRRLKETEYVHYGTYLGSLTRPRTEVEFRWIIDTLPINDWRLKNMTDNEWRIAHSVGKRNADDDVYGEREAKRRR